MAGRSAFGWLPGWPVSAPSEGRNNPKGSSRAKMLAGWFGAFVLMEMAAANFLSPPKKLSRRGFTVDMSVDSRGSGQGPWPTESRNAAAKG